MAVESDGVGKSGPEVASPSSEIASPSGEVAEPSGEAEESPHLSRDDVFDLLSNRRRRWALHVLEQPEGSPTELRELSGQVAGWENGKPVEDVTDIERRRVYTSLQQFHLPKLHAKGIVEYDEQHGTVERTTGGTDLDVYLDVVAGNEIPWSLYYVGLSALSIVTIAGVWIGVSPLTVLPDIAWGLIIALAFGVSALVHVFQSRRTRLGAPGPPGDLREL